MAAGEPKREPTLCHGLLEAIAASLRAQAEAKGVKLVVAQDAEDIVARTDRRLLSTIVRSLVGYAIDNARQGTMQVSVQCTATGPGRLIEFNIAGFATGDAQLLSRSQELAAAIGGKVSMHFKPGEGSTYVLQIPEG